MGGGPEEIIQSHCDHCGSFLWCWCFTADCQGDAITLCMKCMMDIVDTIKLKGG